ncbi:restriction endonuclease subunit S [Azospirillum brasilense]|nr:restriction endonuclease subunit S [Azospirillum brasilense]
MNADRLLALYERVADAPDAVARLRRFILDLAVRGKLVPQDPKDEPASELLKRIACERNQIIADRKMRGAKPPPPPSLDYYHDIPTTWQLCSLGQITIVTDPNPSHRYPDYSGGSVPILSTREFSGDDGWDTETAKLTTEEFWQFQKEICDFADGDIIFARKGRLGLPRFLPNIERFTFSHTLFVLKPMMGLDPVYLLWLLRRDAVVEWLTRQMNQNTGVPTLGKATTERLPVPLPPLAEQRRIVAKVDELMALCDRMEEVRQEREATRNRLTAATLARLNAPDPETFHDDALFALDALPALATSPDQIKQLRQTILNLAVRGKLVPQDPSDEPASELLKRLSRLEKPARYEKRSRELIVGECGLSVNDPKTALPRGWLWKPLVEIARLESGHTPSRNRPDWWNGKIPWMGLVDARLHNGRTIYDTIQHTNEEGIANSAARILPSGTVCFSRTASVGYVVIMGRPMATSQDFVNWVPTEAITSSFLQLVMIAERPAIGRFSKGAVHQTIYYPAWLAMHIALPPVAEQRRIVAKVDELMALCDQLEESLIKGEDTRSRLLDALLAEALAPAEDRKMEAAE